MSGNERKIDLRVQKTERALMDAMLTLLKEKPFDSITVSDLCDTAMVRRATFYTHFRDKYDFLDFCIAEKQRQFDCTALCGDTVNSLETCAFFLRDMLHYFQENDALLQSFCKHVEADRMTGLLARQLRNAIEQAAESMSKSGTPLVAPPQVLSAFFSGALLGVCRWWFLEKPEDMSEEALIDHILSILAACMPAILKEKKEEASHERKPAQPE